MKSFTASTRDWSNKAKRNARLVVLEGSESVYRAMTERQASVKETGSFVAGLVPVDTGNLVNSVRVGLNGATQDADFTAAVGGFEGGDTIDAYYTADYAAAVNYGTANMAGRFFVTNAVARWKEFIARAARRYKD